MPTVTVEQVRATCSSTLPDAAIQTVIDATTCKVGACLDSSYVTCPDVAEQILLYLVCHFLTMTTQSGVVTSQKWPNGASINFTPYVTGGTGLAATNFGLLLLQFDSEQCVAQAFPNRRVFVKSLGNTGISRTPYRRNY